MNETIGTLVWLEAVVVDEIAPHPSDLAQLLFGSPGEDLESFFAICVEEGVSGVFVKLGAGYIWVRVQRRA